MSIQNFIPEVWNAAIMQAMYETHIFAQPQVVNRNYEGEIKNQGDTVHITGIEPVSIGDYDRYMDIKFEEIDLNTRTMFIDQAKYFGLRIDDIDKWQEKSATMPSAMHEAGYAMAREVDLYLAKTLYDYVVTDNQLDAVTMTGTDFDADGQKIRNVFVDLRTRLRRNNVPEAGRWAIVTPEVYAILLKDPHFIKANERGSSSVIEGNGVVGSIYGFTIMESNNAPVDLDGGTDSTHTIIAGNNTAVSYAEALTQTEAVRFEKSFGDGVKGLHVYGAKGIRPEGLCRIDVEGLNAAPEPVSFRDTSEADLDASRFPRTLTGAAGEKPGPDEVDVDPADGVSDKVPESLAVTPKTTSVAVSGTKDLTATLTYTDGSTEDVTAVATWTSSDESKATVAVGTVTGVAAGSANITATSQEQTATAKITVTA